VNNSMPAWVVTRVARALNKHGKAVNDSKILVLGLAYKPDIDDVRESPSFELIERLEKGGARVDYNDPHVPQTHYMRHWGDIGKKSVALSPETLKQYDCVLVATNHKAYDWQLIADHAKLVVDTRNALVNVKGRREHIVKA
jgi:UDP-N-acetyl-D-glucosamine dehydrogenase